MSSKNFSKTLIYRIQCGDNSIFGHTTNLSQLKAMVKRDCLSGKKTKITKQILENGGYEKCQWFILEQYKECESLLQAHARVDYYKALSLNPNESFIDPKRIHVIATEALIEKKEEIPDGLQCKNCMKKFTLKTNLTRHLKKSCKKIECKDNKDRSIEELKCLIINIIHDKIL